MGLMTFTRSPQRKKATKAFLPRGTFCPGALSPTPDDEVEGDGLAAEAVDALADDDAGVAKADGADLEVAPVQPEPLAPRPLDHPVVLQTMITFNNCPSFMSKLRTKFFINSKGKEPHRASRFFFLSKSNKSWMKHTWYHSMMGLGFPTMGQRSLTVSPS